MSAFLRDRPGFGSLGPPIIAGATKTVSISESELDENCTAFDDLRRCRELRIGKSVSPLPRFGSDTVGWVFTYQLRDGPRLCGSGRAGAGHDTGSSRGDDSRARMESKEVPSEKVALVACCRRATLSAGLRPAGWTCSAAQKTLRRDSFRSYRPRRRLGGTSSFPKKLQPSVSGKSSPGAKGTGPV
jgi:hypothetical protein